ncbi:MAG: glucosaminidase domain-containing protein [Muribaculaceae bacterium]|nr:glucosaminidase domain-containing protein [Muribaculaceae bacterium]
MLRYFVFIIGLVLPAFSVMADVYEDYIGTYSSLAIEQQEEFGIPASITLAQGLLESAAGRSSLATKGNNHFGIKCHKEWKGESMLRNDDAPNECFRVYNSPEESFRDHSLFLKRDRYKSLFRLDPTDYRNWAFGLKECGYATDPNYGARLVAIIERYSLYNFDTLTGAMDEETVQFIMDSMSHSHPVRKSRGLHYVMAFPGDTYKSIAKEFGLKEKKLKEFNDAGRSDNIKEWEEVYLEPKREVAPEGVNTVTIGEDDDMRSVSQRYGISLKALKALNKKAKDTPGTLLKLR